MLGTVKINGETTDSFPISTGVKQGCTIASTLFIIYFDTMLKEALRNCNEGIYVRVRTDGSLFNLARLRAHTKTRIPLVQELLYADDCGIFAHCDTGLQNLMDNFVRASYGFGLTVSISKTEVVFQPSLGIAYEEPQIVVDGTPLKVSDSFTYLGSRISKDGQLDAEIDTRIGKASSSFGRLYSRVWNSHNLRAKVKIDVYSVVVLSTLLYASETWTIYSRHMKKLEAFHQRYLRRIMKISWESHTTNLEVLQLAGMTFIATEILKKHLKLVGHVTRMSDNRLPKQLLYGELQEGSRPKGRPRKRFKDELLVSLKKFDDLKRCTDRAQWRSLVHNGAKTANERTERIIDRRTRREDPAQATDRGFNCQCGKKCASAAGLAAHQR